MGLKLVLLGTPHVDEDIRDEEDKINAFCLQIDPVAGNQFPDSSIRLDISNFLIYVMNASGELVCGSFEEVKKKVG